MPDPFTETCYQLLTRHLPLGPARQRAQERLRTHPHFTVLRELLDAHEILPVPAASRAVLLETPDGCLLLPPHDAVQMPVIARYGNFQRDDLLRVLEFLEMRNLLRGEVFVDIGANVGAHTLHALRSGRFRRAIAVEPCPANVRLLGFNMRLNALADQVEISACALGAFEGTSTLVVNPLNCGDARLAPADLGRERALGEDDFESVEVPVMTFDGLLESHHCPVADIGLVWMDTQGSEGHVLGAAQSLVDTDVPLYVEFWPYGLQALRAYAPLKAFVQAHCSAVVTFEGGTAAEHRPDDLDRLFDVYEAEQRFTDLLLLR